MSGGRSTSRWSLDEKNWSRGWWIPLVVVVLAAATWGFLGFVEGGCRRGPRGGCVAADGYELHSWVLFLASMPTLFVVGTGTALLGYLGGNFFLDREGIGMALEGDVLRAMYGSGLYLAGIGLRIEPAPAGVHFSPGVERGHLPPAFLAATEEGVTAPREHRSVYDAHGTENLPGRLVRDEGAPATHDVAVNEAYDGLGDTWTLYRDVYGRNSIDDHGLTTGLWRDRRNEFKREFGALGVPTSVVIDADGAVVASFPGAVDFAGEDVSRALDTARAGSA